MTNIPVYDDIQDPAISDRVKMDPNLPYQVLTTDQVKTESNPARVVISLWQSRC